MLWVPETLAAEAKAICFALLCEEASKSTGRSSERRSGGFCNVPVFRRAISSRRHDVPVEVQILPPVRVSLRKPMRFSDEERLAEESETEENA